VNRAGGKIFPAACFPSRGAARGRRRTALRGGWARTASALRRGHVVGPEPAQVVQKRTGYAADSAGLEGDGAQRLSAASSSSQASLCGLRIA
jgi:hypothetical protein